jgi:hypothetical protein
MTNDDERDYAEEAYNQLLLHGMDDGVRCDCAACEVARGLLKGEH